MSGSRVAVALLCWSLAFGAMSCDSGDDDAGGEGEGIAFEELADPLTAALCAYFVRCCDSEELQNQLDLGEGDPVVDDEEGCVAVLAGGVEQALAGVGDAIDAGRMAYDAGGAAVCLDGVAALECGLLDLQIFPCVDPLVEADGACDRSDECVTGLCSGSGGGQGVCAPIPGGAEPCPDGVCGDGLYCDGATGTCLATKADGEPCDGDAECTSGGCRSPNHGNTVCGPPVCDGV